MDNDGRTLSTASPRSGPRTTRGGPLNGNLWETTAQRIHAGYGRIACPPPERACRQGAAGLRRERHQKAVGTGSDASHGGSAGRCYSGERAEAAVGTAAVAEPPPLLTTRSRAEMVPARLHRHLFAPSLLSPGTPSSFLFSACPLGRPYLHGRHNYVLCPRPPPPPYDSRRLTFSAAVGTSATGGGEGCVALVGRGGRG